MRPARVGSAPKTTFSATVIESKRRKCWCTMPSPAAMASSGPWKERASPSTTISPESGRTRPNRIDISVDLPAPFSPITAWMAPLASTRSMPSFATTAPNLLLIALSSTAAVLIRR
jgi:hypothetical protein